MEDRGLFNGRGFWALALLWLPAGVVAQALVRFLPATDGPPDQGMWLAAAPMAAASLAVLAPCGLPLPAPDPIRGRSAAAASGASATGARPDGPGSLLVR